MNKDLQTLFGVRVLEIRSVTSAKLEKTIPWHARVMWGKS